MRRFQLIMTASTLMVVSSAYRPAAAQVLEAWVAPFAGPAGDQDRANDIAVDGAGFVYVTGHAFWGTTSDYATIKYTPAGSPLWVARYEGPGGSYDEASALAVDAAGNVYVTGTSRGPGGTHTANDYATVKYDTNGNELWVRRYNGPVNNTDEATAIALDAAGNCYVTGGSDGAGFESNTYDIATIKYDTNGNELWVRRYNGPGQGQFSHDIGWDLLVDNLGNVHVTGSSDEATSFYDMVTLKYDSSGNQLWASRYDGAGGADGASALAVDASGNVFVAGGSAPFNGPSYDYSVIMYDVNGNLIWGHIRTGGGWAMDLAVDGAGDVVVVGVSAGACTTVKYDSAGTEMWSRAFDAPGNAASGGNAIAVSGSGAVHVLGSADTGSCGSGCWPIDLLTIKYDGLGNELWAVTYEGSSGNADLPSAIAVDASENVYVTGSEDAGAANAFDYVTIKYETRCDLGTIYCSPAAPNSTGTAAIIAVCGSPAVVDNQLTLIATDLPPGAFGFFLTSTHQGFTANPGGSQGNLCLDGAIGRYVGPGQIQNSGASGSFGLVLDLAATPTPTGLVSVAPGETWNFQVWHRDANPGPTSNFTDAVSVTFQ